MPKSNYERWLRPLEVSLAGIAVVLSVVAFIVATRFSRQTNNIANDALAVAKQSLRTAEQANKISAGLEYPQIEITMYSEIFRVLTLKDVESQRISWNVWNRGPTNVYGIQVQVIPVGGFTQAVDDVDERYSILGGPSTTMIDFDQILPPDAFVVLDITRPVLEKVRSLKLSYRDPKKVYESILNIVLAPRKGKDEPAIQARITRSSMPDRRALKVEFIPEIIESEDVVHLLNEKKPYHPISVPQGPAGGTLR